MKNRNIIAASLLAIASAVSAQAQIVTPRPDIGDLILGFAASSGTGADKNIEAALGKVDQILALAPGQSINYSSKFSTTDLNSTFGSNSALKWGVVAASATYTNGGTTHNGELFKSTYWGTQAAAPTGDLSKSDTASGSIIGMTSFLGNQSHASTATSAIIDAAAGGSWTTYKEAGDNFLFFTGPVTQSMGTSVDFYQIIARVPGARPGRPDFQAAEVKLLGSFAMSADGSSLTFNAIPEPSTYAAIFGGLTLAFVAFRRRFQKKLV